MIEFVLHCEPPKHTAQGSSMILKSKKTGKYFIGKKSNSKAIQTKEELLTMLMSHAPKKPLESAIALKIDIFYSWRKSETKKNKAKLIMPVITKPDLDNWVKQFNDCLTRLAFWRDDAQVFDLHIRKFYADVPRIEVKIIETD
ncbi:MAG: RusA family crossover junction endodeoxyribonuclease [Methanobrevibacter sp.]|nr:RusA family crossover junction endodeoxyribonuclease [Methanobrevibacter sp.]MBO7712718.1 RusA family crossover junction endodeoxyribonuclease [Methanobrevibacter sp.]